jgi:hypothetical protein
MSSPRVTQMTIENLVSFETILHPIYKVKIVSTYLLWRGRKIASKSVKNLIFFKSGGLLLTTFVG